jgi:hypothetical protein
MDSDPDDDDIEAFFVINSASDHSHSVLHAHLHSVQGQMRSPPYRAGDQCLFKKPGRGISAYGEKSLYVRVGSNRLYENARAFHRPEFFYTQVGFTTTDFDTILGVVAVEIAKPLNPRLLRAREKNDAIVSRKRAFAPAEMFFLYLQVMRGANEGRKGLETISFSHGISIGTCSKYLYPAAHAVYYALKQCRDAKIQWTPPADSKTMRGLIYGFTNSISFVDGTKVRTWRQSDPERQEAQYCGHHHFQSVASLQPLITFKKDPFRRHHVLLLRQLDLTQ